MKKHLAVISSLILVGLFSNFSSAFAQVPGKSDLNSNFDYLAKGINIEGWFVGQYPISDKHLATFMCKDDIQRIKAMGFTHIRFPVEPDLIFDRHNPHKANPARLEILAAAVKMIQDTGLGVIVDMHPYDLSVKQKLASDDMYLKDFAEFWTTVAKRLSFVDNRRIFFETLNEPNFYRYTPDSVSRWRSVQNLLVSAIRKGAPRNTIIVKGSDWEGVDSLQKMGKLNDPNLVYSFHFYNMMEFTHQGSRWSSGPYRDLHDLPYPVSADCQERVKMLSSSARQAATFYCQSNFNSRQIEKEFVKAANWAKANNVKLYLGEFGVMRSNVSLSDRSRWISDVRALGEKYGMAWAIWEYNRVFSIVSQSDPTKIEPSIAKSLNLVKH